MGEFWGTTFTDLEQTCQGLRVPQIHAKAVFRAAYKEASPTPWLTPGLPKALTAHLGSAFGPCGPLAVAQEQVSRYDASVKFLLRLADGALIEAVLMPESQRITLCISSQVGCAQACAFCHTGRMGLTRNLSAAEIVGQVMTANAWLAEHPSWLTDVRLSPALRVTNVVFMGMGEPLDNVEAVIKAVRILTNPYGLSLAMRRISVSTAGHGEGLAALLAALPQVSLAVSIHAADDGLRSRLMPINRRWPLAELMGSLKSHGLASRAGLLVQYTLIGGVNDGEKHAAGLSELLHELKAKVKINLIPLNPIGPSAFAPPERDAVHAFRDHLQEAGYRVMVRYSKGQDIGAACGQLVTTKVGRPALQESH